ncbi:Hypothetical predicted protein [Pelobates cultripes]|uniref:Uncharacterized protein n=1 Tax=Pelobates cultripes TaxID=61616 RepID=A0AAD1S7Q4_PELCU|nr:Hypothetical predicted protein [Pelobates cultripes]
MAASKPNYTLHLRAALRLEAFAPDSGQHWRAPPSHLTPGLDLASTTAFLGLEPLRALLIPKPNTWTHHTYQSSRYRPAMEPEPWAQMVGSCGARGRRRGICQILPHYLSTRVGGEETTGPEDSACLTVYCLQRAGPVEPEFTSLVFQST